MVGVRNSGSDQQAHFAINCFPHDSLRQPVFTGPDGLYPHRSHRLVNRRPLGTNPYTREATWDADYLWRAPPIEENPGPTQGLPVATYGQPFGTPRRPSAILELPPATVAVPVHLRPRSSFAGEIGWHQFAFRNLYPAAACTGHQILTSEFRRQLEDRYTHRYQNPWYPAKGERPDHTREGAYFCLFPGTGQRAHTSHDYRSSKSHSQSSGSSKGLQQRQWKRAPAATPITMHSTTQDRAGRSDDTAGSEFMSEEGDVGGGRAGNEGAEKSRPSHKYNPSSGSGQRAYQHPRQRQNLQE